MTIEDLTVPRDASYDLVISGGRIVDGSGEPAFVGDVGIDGDRVTAIGDLSSARFGQRIDASGMIVMPGMIDMHGHSDHSLLMSSSAQSKLSQGVTTDILGNCGMSGAPFRPANSLLGFTTEAAVDALGGRSWTTMASYMELLQECRPGLNVATQVGYGTALQLAQLETNDVAERATIALGHIREALEAGAVGATFGLYYPPERDCHSDELERVTSLVASQDAIISVHLRDEGGFSIGLDEAIDEIIRVCRPSNTRLEISHLKALGPGGWERIDRALELILQAKAEGMEIGADQYPYEAGELALVDALGLPRDLATTGAEIDIDQVNFRIAQRGGADRMVVAHANHRQDLLGLDLTEAVALVDLPFLDAIRVLVVDENVTVASFVVRETDLTRIMQYPWVGVGSDGVSIPLDLFSHLDNPHPRNFGCFSRYISRYVRDAQAVSLELGVRKATALPAERLRLKDRGQIRVGSYADIAVFKLEELNDHATYTEPSKLSSGMSHVIVNGKFAVHNGSMTDAGAGRVLSRS